MKTSAVEASWLDEAALSCYDGTQYRRECSFGTPPKPGEGENPGESNAATSKHPHAPIMGRSQHVAP